jgi:hypothetical protein
MIAQKIHPENNNPSIPLNNDDDDAVNVRIIIIIIDITTGAFEIASVSSLMFLRTFDRFSRYF